MFTLFYLLGWSATVALVVRLWTRSGAGRSALPAALVGVVVGLFWPITLWIAGGLWWRRRAPGTASRPPLVSTVAVCAAGSLATFVALGAAAPPPAPAPLAASTAPTTTATAPPPTAAPAPLLVVVDVADGDTVDLSDGREVRLLGIDAPEVGECGYEEATAFARTALLGRPVQVAPDPTQAATDRYGRALLYIGAPQDYSVAVTGAGWAEHYVVGGTPVQKAPQIEAAQLRAQTEGLGIWGSPCATATPTPAPTTSRQAPPDADEGDDASRRALAAPAPQPQPQPQPRPQPQPQPAPEPEPVPEPEPEPASGCHPSYVPCVPDGPDLDCGELGYAVRVVGPDEFRLDGDDDDGRGCESYG